MRFPRSLITSPVVLLLLMPFVVPALAQAPSAPLSVLPNSIAVAGSNSLSVSTTSANVALSSSTAPTVFVTNLGQNAAYIALGSGSVTASINCPGNCLVPPGQTIAVGIAGNTYLAGITQSGTTTLSISEGNLAPSSTSAPLPVTGASSNPTSTLTRPANTTAYAQGELIASSTTAGSVVVPSIPLGPSIVLARVRLATNVTTGWGGASLTVTLWSSAPTYTNGDGGAYAPATTGAGTYMVAQFPITLTQFADGAAGNGALAVGNAVLLPGGTYYWDIEDTNSAGLTPISQQTFTLTAEVAH